MFPGVEKVLVTCDGCGVEFLKLPRTVRAQNFCTLECMRMHRFDHSKVKSGGERNNQGTKTLCFSCAKATTGECSWSRDFVPVKGWTATEWIFAKGNERMDPVVSYEVEECPEYEYGKRELGGTEEDFARLTTAILECAINDYIRATVKIHRYKSKINRTSNTREAAALHMHLKEEEYNLRDSSRYIRERMDEDADRVLNMCKQRAAEKIARGDKE